jgi:putative hemolysin
MLVFSLAVVLALVFSFLCSTSEAVLLSVSHAEIEAIGKSRAGETLRRFKKEIDVPIAAILILNTFANTIGAAIAGATYGRVFDPSTLWIFTLGFTLSILLLSEIVPKTMGVTFAGRLAAPVALFVSFLVVVLKPLLFLTRGISGALRRGQERPVTSIEEIRLLASLGRTEGVVAARTADIIEGAAALRELTAYDIMVPRNGVAFLSGERTLEENLTLIKRTGHSRFPFSPDGNLDTAEGIVLVKELMFRLREAPEPLDWKSVLGPLIFVPSSTPLERLLRTFQEERRHMAIVVDEYGGIQGIVTMEDVLEEIVGEIEDESDRVDPYIIRRPDDSLLCRGWAETRKVFELLGIDEEVELVTLGGFVAELLGRVPRTNDEVDWNGYRFSVLRATARRAERVAVRKVSDAESMRPPPEKPLD